MAGIRFFLKYAIEPPHPQGQLFYFKLFMNGRHISSWGVNPRTNPRGQVLRGLFEPDGMWSFSDNNRITLKRSGIESRPFLFTPDIDGKSAADDGGLIEVRIFRANARKRRAPDLITFRSQERYGIKCVPVDSVLNNKLTFYSLPSAGLLDKPQDTRYFDYILVDPKDEPYADFLFHYRSWESLQSLQLIPSSHPRVLLKPSNSFAFLAGPSASNALLEKNMEEHPYNDEDDNDEEFRASYQDSSSCITHISQLRNSKFLKTANDRPSHISGQSAAFKSSSLSQERRELRTNIPFSTFSVPHAKLDEWLSDRPLPRLRRPSLHLIIPGTHLSAQMRLQLHPPYFPGLTVIQTTVLQSRLLELRSRCPY